MAYTYSVLTGEGGELATQMTLERARVRAAELADERGESVFVCGPGLAGESDEVIGEEVAPEGDDSAPVEVAP